MGSSTYGPCVRDKPRQLHILLPVLRENLYESIFSIQSGMFSRENVAAAVQGSELKSTNRILARVPGESRCWGLNSDFYRAATLPGRHQQRLVLPYEWQCNVWEHSLYVFLQTRFFFLFSQSTVSARP